MKVIIAGTRTVAEMRYLHRVLVTTELPITTILTGGARGVDTLALRYAKQHGIPCEVYPADWETHGRAAGPIRNRTMAQHGEALIALWDGCSAGTRNMIETMRGYGKPVEVCLLPNRTRL